MKHKDEIWYLKQIKEGIMNQEVSEKISKVIEVKETLNKELKKEKVTVRFNRNFNHYHNAEGKEKEVYEKGKDYEVESNWSECLINLGIASLVI